MMSVDRCVWGGQEGKRSAWIDRSLMISQGWHLWKGDVSTPPLQKQERRGIERGLLSLFQLVLN